MHRSKSEAPVGGLGRAPGGSGSRVVAHGPLSIAKLNKQASAHDPRAVRSYLRALPSPQEARSSLFPSESTPERQFGQAGRRLGSTMASTTVVYSGMQQRNTHSQACWNLGIQLLYFMTK